MTGETEHTSARIEIDERSYVLDADQDLDDVMSVIATAAGGQPSFVTIRSIGQTINVLIQPTTQVILYRQHRSQLETAAALDLPRTDLELMP
ncbi:hypothetical protein [Microbacterium sp. WCS2018Hpa-9]|uniref:hypothetical protein n=1 Tax=Microbacterium sp. WCS2018Hpa-9 TaxID=3073635 RepID=UPI00288AC611|nr:hypothetical protein [Microbacterium sp. WCS2018Hpa-9]